MFLLATACGAEGKTGWRVLWEGRALVLEFAPGAVVRIRGILVAVGGRRRNLLAPPFKALRPREKPGLFERTFVLPTAQGGKEFTVAVKVSEGKASLLLRPANGAQVGVEAEVEWGADPWLCRLKPSSNPDVVQVALGELRENPRCDALFDRFGDRALVASSPRVIWRKEGERVRLWAEGPPKGVLTLTAIERYYRERLGIKFYQPIDKTVKTRFPKPVSGWCSWYHFYQGVDEAKVLANARVVAEKLKPFGAEYIQVDDGWQGKGFGGGENRDWLTISPKFPHGMRFVASEIRKLGLKAGLWLIPQGQSNVEYVKANRGAFLWTEEGSSPFCKLDEKGRVKEAAWQGAFIVDPTSSEGLALIRSLMRKLAEDWGFDYFKIDGQPTINEFYRRHRRLFRDPGRDPDEAYRDTLRAVREAIGPGRFLLGCYGIPLSGIGIMDGSRTGGDVSASWGGFQPALRATMRWYFLHNVCWYCDPDCLLVRPPLTLDQARAWATLYAITGQHLMASDDLTTLPPERMAILQKVFPNLDIRPVDLYPYKGRPRVWDLKVSKGGETYDVVAVFNWRYDFQPLTVKFPELGLPGSVKFDVFEFWTWRYVGRVEGGFSFSLPPTSARVFIVKGALDRPRVLATSRHLVACYVDEVEERWDPRRLVLSGRSKVVGGFPYKVAIIAPWRPRRFVAVLAEAEGRSVKLTQEGPLVTVGWIPSKDGVVNWSVKFEEKPPLPPSRPRAPKGLRAEVRDRRVVLTWEPVEGAAFYKVFCGGEFLGSTFEPKFIDPRLGFRKRIYEVRAVNFEGQESEPSGPLPFLPPKVSELYLDEVWPSFFSQDWGELRMRRSVEGNPIRIGGREFKRGLGTHARSTIIYKLDGSFRFFSAWVGVDDEKGGAGTVVFQVFVDGRKAFESGVMRGKQPPKRVLVNIEGGRELRLVVTDAGDGISCDHADWADAKLLAGEPEVRGGPSSR